MPGVMHYLQAGDGVIRGVAVLLLLMSVVTWCLAIGRAWVLWRVARLSRLAPRAFWAAPSLEAGVSALTKLDGEALFAPLAIAGVAALHASHITQGAASASALASATASQTHVASQTHAASKTHAASQPSLNARSDQGECVLRAMRPALLASQRRLESGQTLLATMASVSPFVGLLGTVWGIYHALIGIAASGQPALSDVAGPVGEALIMTAFGLAVAIPAVVAYNLLGRGVRAGNEALDGFARDLHRFLADEGDGEQTLPTSAEATEKSVRSTSNT